MHATLLIILLAWLLFTLLFIAKDRMWKLEKLEQIPVAQMDFTVTGNARDQYSFDYIVADVSDTAGHAKRVIRVAHHEIASHGKLFKRLCCNGDIVHAELQVFPVGGGFLHKHAGLPEYYWVVGLEEPFGDDPDEENTAMQLSTAYPNCRFCVHYPEDLQ